ncbi:MAG TPA: ABC transporter permease [Lacunisphaera sp.]|jgi:predicted permease
MLADLRHAVRALGRTPGFTAIALLTLALGIGLNTAMFNVVNSVALQPLRFPEADRLFRLQHPATGQQDSDGNRPAHFIEIEREISDIAEVACFRPWSFTLSEPGRSAEVINSLRASAAYFHILGLPMKLGRGFTPDEDQPGHNQVVVLSEALWRSHFAADPAVVGRTIRLDGQPNEIIGVAPAAINDPRIHNAPDLYRPLALTADEIADRVDHAYDIIGRFRPDAGMAQVKTRLASITSSLTTSDPKEYTGHNLLAVSLKPELRGTSRQIIFMLIGLSGFVLLIACANLANLLLARAIARAREFAIRSALGASRSQLMGPLFTECGLLTFTGGALGILVCVWTNEWMARQFSESGTEITFAVDWRLLLFAFGASLATGIFFGIVPAWLISRVRANDALKCGARGSTGDLSQSRFRQALIVAQFTLAFVLLSGAVFFVRGLDRLIERKSGWNPAPLLRGVLSMPAIRYPDADHQMRFYEKVQERVSSLPGVAAAAISYDVPAFGFPSGRGFVVDGQPTPATGNDLGAPINGITPGYFNTIGTHLLRGRDFSWADRRDSAPVIIINETMARTLFPGKDAIGRRLAYDEKEPVWMEIVGIAEDVKFMNVGRGFTSFQTYIPLSQATWSYVALSVRGAAPAETLMKPIREAVNELDPDMAIKDFSPVSNYVRRGVADFIAIDHLLAGFASLGLFLAALGIYSVIARLVALRTGEIGIRMALGAQVADIARLVVGEGMRPVLVGTGIGVLGAAALSRFLASAMPGLATSSFATIAISGAVLTLLALIACYLSARRATKVDPMVALRTE